MKRHIWRNAPLAAVVLATFMAVGCSTVPYPNIDGSGLDPKTLPDPATHTLLYGTVGLEPSLFNDGSGLYVDFAQINPEVEPMLVNVGRDRRGFWMLPVPLKSTMHAVYYQHTEGRVTYYANLGIQKGQDITFKAEKPGLQYVGGFTLRVVTQGEFFGAASTYGFFKDPYDKKTEYELLKAVLKDYKNTPWEEFIVARIEELQK